MDEHSARIVQEAENIVARTLDRRDAVDLINNADESAIVLAIVWEHGRLRWRASVHPEADVRNADYLMMMSLVQTEFVERERRALNPPAPDCEA